jgi:hypothetical protein
VTGLIELWLMTAAAFRITEHGQAIAGELRAHMAATGLAHQFTASAWHEGTPQCTVSEPAP